MTAREPTNRAVVALGGNALLRRGEPPEADAQLRAARLAAHRLAQGAREYRLIVTHGNGPQIGLLALMSEAYGGARPYPLDVLGSESEGQIGYVLELELDNALRDRHTATLLTRVVVDREDPAFEQPTKFIGPIYRESQARALSAEHGWSIRPDGNGWRRVVPSPEPQQIVQLEAIRELESAGFLVVCAGGGGIPVVIGLDGRQHGVEAVIDKDLSAALLASELSVDTLVLATDVDAVYRNFGSPLQRAISHATPAGLRRLTFPPGSMGAKVAAVCGFVERTGGRAAIGSLDQVDQLLRGDAGTQITADGQDIKYRERNHSHEWDTATAGAGR